MVFIIFNHFITIKNGKKLFFNIFIKKYWLNWMNCKYSNLDIYRRIKIIECFEFLLQKYDISSEDENTIIIETIFFRFIVKKYYFRKWAMRYELLSFYDK